MSVQALRQPTRHSCAHAAHWDYPGEFGRLWKVSPKSAGPIRGAHSACACHAALSSVHEIGPHSSELAVRFANEKGVPCRTRSWSLWLMILLKMAWAPGAVLPNCSNTTGVMPLSRACKLYPSRWPYALHLVILLGAKMSWRLSQIVVTFFPRPLKFPPSLFWFSPNKNLRWPGDLQRDSNRANPLAAVILLY